jgi:type III secretory pathway component EscU
MERENVRDEILEELRREIDGVNSSESELPPNFQTKRRRLKSEVESRNNLSRSILKLIGSTYRLPCIDMPDIDMPV